MGVCYSQQQQWQAYKQTRRNRYRRNRHNKTSSVIYEQKSIYQSSFASNVYSSFRDDLHHTISSLAAENGEMVLGSLVEMKEDELDILYKSLHKINSDGERHVLTDSIILCNLKTKNYLHTHKIKLPECKLYNQVSCCPYTSNHIPEYDIWRFVEVEEKGVKVEEKEEEEKVQLDRKSKEQIQAKVENNEDQSVRVYIYHPFTQRFLAYERGNIVGSQNKSIWRVTSFGPRRNGGFVRISLEGQQQKTGQLCMSQQKALLDKHRKTQLCPQKHISHIWQLNFIDPESI